MTLFVTLTLAEADTGPFNIFSDVDGFTSALAINVSKATLLAGLSLPSAPDGTTIIRVRSVGLCTTILDMSVGVTTTTSSTTTSTTSSTTTTTTTVGPVVLRVHQICCVPNDLTVRYVDLPALLGFGATATFTATDGKPYTLIDSIFVPGLPDIFQNVIDTNFYVSCVDWNNINICP